MRDDCDLGAQGIAQSGAELDLRFGEFFAVDKPYRFSEGLPNTRRREKIVGPFV